MKESELEITEKGIIVIESLTAYEPNTGKELYNSLLRWKELQQKDFFVRYYKVTSIEEFQRVIKQTVSNHKTGSVYTLHLETHGCNEGIGLSNGEVLPWKLFGDWIRPLNIKMHGLLVVVLAMCNGAGVILSANCHERSPFKAFIGATRPVTVGVIDTGFYEFYNRYNDMLDVTEAYKALCDNTIDQQLGCSPFWLMSDFELFDKLTDLDRDQIALQGWVEKISRVKNVSLAEAEGILRANFEVLKKNKPFFCFDDLYREKAPSTL